MAKTIQIMIEKRGKVTNGDMLKSIFPNAIIDKKLYTYCVCVKLPYHTRYDTGLLFDKDWWNTPYEQRVKQMTNEMTAEEAVKILRFEQEQVEHRLDGCSDTQENRNIYEAFRMAIQALEAHPMRDATEEERKSVKDYIESISKPTGFKFEDLISREELIKQAFSVYYPLNGENYIKVIRLEDVEKAPIAIKKVLEAQPQCDKCRYYDVSLDAEPCIDCCVPYENLYEPNCDLTEEGGDEN